MPLEHPLELQLTGAKELMATETSLYVLKLAMCSSVSEIGFSPQLSQRCYLISERWRIRGNAHQVEVLWLLLVFQKIRAVCVVFCFPQNCCNLGPFFPYFR